MGEFKENLRTLRKEKKMSQSDLTKICDVTNSSISLWERGKTSPDIDNLLRLSDFFGVSVDFLIGASDYRQEKNKAAELTKDEAELLSLFRSTDSDGKRFLLTAARKINAPGILRKNAL